MGSRASADAALQRDGRPLPKRFEEILDVAARLFAEQGYEATSIQGIANELGILKGSVYHYIETKGDLLFWIILDVHEALRANLREHRDRFGISAEERLHGFLRNHAQRNMEDWQRGSIFFRDFAYLSEDRRATVLAARAEFEQFVQDVIRQGQSDGVFAPDIDVKIASFALLGMINSLYVWYRPHGPLPAEAIAEQYATLALRALRRPPPEAASENAARTPARKRAPGRKKA